MWLFLWTTAKTKQGNHAFFTQQTRNQETAHYNFCTHPYNPTRCVLFPLYFLGFGPILLCILEEVCRPTIPRFGQQHQQENETPKEWRGETKRQGGEIRSSRKWYKGGTFGLLFLLLVRGNDAGGEQAHLVRRRRRQRRKKTTTLKWRDRTAGCAADGSRFRAKRWCRGLA